MNLRISAYVMARATRYDYDLTTDDPLGALFAARRNLAAIFAPNDPGLVLWAVYELPSSPVSGTYVH